MIYIPIYFTVIKNLSVAISGFTDELYLLSVFNLKFVTLSQTRTHNQTDSKKGLKPEEK